MWRARDTLPRPDLATCYSYSQPHINSGRGTGLTTPTEPDTPAKTSAVAAESQLDDDDTSGSICITKLTSRRCNATVGVTANVPQHMLEHTFARTASSGPFAPNAEDPGDIANTLSRFQDIWCPTRRSVDFNIVGDARRFPACAVQVPESAFRRLRGLLQFLL